MVCLTYDLSGGFVCECGDLWFGCLWLFDWWLLFGAWFCWLTDTMFVGLVRLLVSCADLQRLWFAFCRGFAWCSFVCVRC